jgi:phage gp36-like protein
MYCNPEDLAKQLPERELLQLADDEGTADGLGAVEDVLVEAIDQADREIDAYAGQARSVPLDPVPGLVANLSCRIAIYRLFARRSTVPEAWQRDYDRCQRLLERIAEGKLKLGAEEGKTAAPETGVKYASAPKRLRNLTMHL